MPEADNSPDGFVYNAADQLRHDLKSPLTIIYARAYLLGRAIRRAPALSDDERATMLAGITAVEAAVQTLCAVIDTIGSPASNGSSDPTEDER